MFKVGDYVVYRKDVCVVNEINEKLYRDKDYYQLIPVNDESLKLDVPVSNNNIRSLISRDDINEIINSIPDIDVLEDNDKYIENEYKNLMLSGSHRNLIKIIKTTYLRNKKRLDNKKKVTDKDNNYFHMAEKYLYTEFSIVLGLSYEDTKKYVIDKVENLLN